MRRLTRREAVAEGLLGLGALSLAGCGGSTPTSTGSTCAPPGWTRWGTDNCESVPGRL